MAKRKQRMMQRIFLAMSFIIFSAVLFINNSTQLLQTFGVPLSQNIITLIAWIGVIGSSFWAVILALMGEFN